MTSLHPPQLTANPFCAVLEESALRVHLVATGGDVISRTEVNASSGAWFSVRVLFTQNQMSVQGESSPWGISDPITFAGLFGFLG